MLYRLFNNRRSSKWRSHVFFRRIQTFGVHSRTSSETVNGMLLRNGEVS
ncbi:MAG: hypothetical protein VXZ96_04770 [Myxococcota bacterium]|nr:hypothetical protein [Myxococcota bacterium]MEC8379607.1 hypothetical protein [Myxococcota bacterium]